MFRRIEGWLMKLFLRRHVRHVFEDPTVGAVCLVAHRRDCHHFGWAIQIKAPDAVEKTIGVGDNLIFAQVTPSACPDCARDLQKARGIK